MKSRLFSSPQEGLLLASKRSLHIEASLFESPALTAGAGRTISLKLESMLPPGSSKIRGIGLACQEYFRRGAKRFISSSGGNAGEGADLIALEMLVEATHASLAIQAALETGLPEWLGVGCRKRDRASFGISVMRCWSGNRYI